MWSSSTGDMGLMPGQGAKILHASQPKKKKKKKNINSRCNIATDSKKMLKMVHIKNIKKTRNNN